MINIKKFLKFVEIQTKVASVIPFSIGTLMALIKHNSINIPNAILMFVSLLCIDMATTGLNHYYDNKRVILKSGYHYQEHNPLSSGELSQKQAKVVLGALLTLGVITGITLVLRTHLMVFVLGSIAFGVGILYSAGPLPISRTLLGEVCSGFFMGGLIPLIAYSIHSDPTEFGTMRLQSGLLTLEFNMHMILPILFVSMPLMLLIGNIMLANNICDMEEDLVNKRYTLPISIGKRNALVLYVLVVCFAVLIVPMAIFLKIMPLLFGLPLLTVPIVIKQTFSFIKNPVKGQTFKYAVKNFLIFSIGIVIGLVAMLLV